MDQGPELATAETEHGPAKPTGPTGPTGPTDAVDPLGLTATTDEPTDGEAATASDLPRRGHRDATPTRIGKYFVLGRLGQGGMGTVYSVYNPDLDRKGVIKLVRADQAGDSGQRRLLREARLMATLSHPNVVQVHDSGLHDGDVYVAMEFIAGVTFDAWRRRGPHPWPAVLAVHRQAGLGLAAAHAKGIVHRDYTPRNAMLGDDGRAVVLDFGLSHGRDAPEPPAPGPTDAPAGELTLTQPGAIVGTPRYMSPEQLRGAPTDARSDQFSFCVVLWEALFDRLPFRGDNIHVYNGAVLEGEIAAPDDLRGVPRSVVDALRRGLAPRPEQRFPDMPALLAALEPPRRGRRGPVLALVAAALALALGLWRAGSQPPSPAEVCAAETAGALAGLWDASSQPPAARARLEAIAERWRATATDLCAAHRGGALPDALHRRGLACLEPHRAVLARVGEQLAGGAAGLDLAELPDPARVAACADPANMSQETSPATPRGREVARRIDDALARSRAALVVGRYGDSEALAAAAVREARALTDGPALAAALYQWARALTYGPRAASAEPALREAAALAVQHDLRDLAADVYLRLLRVAAEDGARPQDGRLWYAALVGHLARLGEREGPREAEAREYLGEIARREGDLAAARADYERALAGRAGAWAFLRTPALIGLARVDLVEGRPAAARARFAEAAQIVEAELGPDHPKLVPLRLGLVEAILETGELEPAEAALARVGAQLGEPPVGPYAAPLDFYRALIAERRGDPPRARRLVEASRRALRAAGPSLRIRAYAPRVLDLAGYLAYETGDSRAALSAYLELLASPDALGEPAVARIAFANAAEIAAGLGESALALRFVAAARSIAPPADPTLARELAADLALFEGQALLAEGRGAAAALVLTAALQAWDQGGDPADARAATLCYTLFTALRDALPALARPYAERARDALARQTPSPQDRLGVLTTWLRAHAR